MEAEQRRLSSMLGHERQTVAMELAAALHHSRDGGLGTNVGLRAHRTASAGPAVYFDLSSEEGRLAGGRAATQSRSAAGFCGCGARAGRRQRGRGLLRHVSRAVEDSRKEEAEKAKEEEARMERIENLILVGAPVSAAAKAALRRWVSGAKRKEKEEEEEEASEGLFLSSWRACLRRWFCLGITQYGEACTVHASGASAAHFAGVWRGSGGASSRRDQGAVLGQGFFVVPVVLLRQVSWSRQLPKTVWMSAGAVLGTRLACPSWCGRQVQCLVRTFLRTCSDKLQQFSDRSGCKLCRRPQRFHRFGLWRRCGPAARAVFQPSMTHSCELSRVLGVALTPGVKLSGVRPPVGA